MGTMKRKKPAPKKPAKKKPARRITRQSAKAKGRNLQKWACEQISKLLGMPWGPDECIASREASQHGTDVRLVGPALEQFPYSVECKWQERWDVPAWIRQAQDNLIPGTDWLLIVKRSYQQPVVMIDAERFFELLAQLREAADDN